ncbi:helix-turn-helix transcriptional regulator [Sphingobacterium multivorum]|uniref:helix-turn-helix transcriptional regulator n=1 Tax=Sphingobacterium multivorum TaxID=28454 RepID=UPI003DA636AB
MYDNDIKRLSRLTAILTQLQTKRLLTSTELANKFSVSVRTIYRDIRALEQAGVPIVTEDGKGYSLMEHYKIPPVMFTEDEANALITAGQLVTKNTDASFVKAHSDAISKIKAVLKNNLKYKTNLLADRIYFAQNETDERTSNHLTLLQSALTNFYVTKIIYSDDSSIRTERIIEPFAILSRGDKWLLIAWCRLRNAFRFFRFDRIEKLTVLTETFEPHNLTLDGYFEKYH